MLCASAGKSIFCSDRQQISKVNSQLILQTRYNNKFKVLVGLSRTNTRNPVANESNEKPDYSSLLLNTFRRLIIKYYILMSLVTIELTKACFKRRASHVPNAFIETSEA